ncbi:MAG: hypothetical protein N2045_12245 [Fimbriimonadales bacterium]|jgi:hypothetical protein|nr:hypothetical protein [Fimbriimonadales bacterium]GBC89435.1 hypothetical protein HRbin14_00158 [bacterium HR14]GIV14443.1 MAG: hypothetical protein KatS3mg021_2725 [Fimbriimonadales bacterium]
MPTLQIDFQDGFQGDTIHIRLENHPEARFANVHTDLRTNLALRYEQTLPPGTYDLEVEIPTRQWNTHLSIDLDQDTYIRFFVRDGEIHYESQHEPYFYL